MSDASTSITDFAPFKQWQQFQTALQIEGGIWKRLDEIRELTQLLQRDAPEFLTTHPWILGWFQSTDNFLTALAIAADPAGTRSFIFPHHAADPNDSWPSMPRSRPHYRPD